MAKKRKSASKAPRMIARRVAGPKHVGIVMEDMDNPNRPAFATFRSFGENPQTTFAMGQSPPNSEDKTAIEKRVWMQLSAKGEVFTTNYDRLIEALLNRASEQKEIDLSVSSVVVPERKSAEGILVKATSIVWATIVGELKNDWTKAYTIPPRVWEEIIAGAYVKAGFDEVTLTPRSGDHGRDIIAVRHGIGSIKILGSVKAYRPGRLITKEEIHALMGVVSLDPNASKGIFTTTSDFAPRLLQDPRLAQAVPHRIELMNGVKLKAWLEQLSSK